MRQTLAEIKARAERLRALLDAGQIIGTKAFAGGGSLPEERMASFALALSPPMGAAGAAALLRTGQPAVVGRIADGRLLLDMLTVSDAELPELAEALKPVLA